MPELRIGVVGVPVMSLALCAVLYATWANGRGRLIDMLWNESNSILVKHFHYEKNGELSNPYLLRSRFSLSMMVGSLQ